MASIAPSLKVDRKYDQLTGVQKECVGSEKYCVLSLLSFRDIYTSVGNEQPISHGVQPGIEAACLTQSAICASGSSSPSWMSIHLDSLLFGVPPDGIGSSEVPLKKVILTYLVRQWTLTNQPCPSIPYNGEFHFTAFDTFEISRVMRESNQTPTPCFHSGIAEIYSCTGASPSAFAICGLPPESKGTDLVFCLLRDDSSFMIVLLFCLTFQHTQSDRLSALSLLLPRPLIQSSLRPTSAAGFVVLRLVRFVLKFLNLVAALSGTRNLTPIQECYQSLFLAIVKPIVGISK